MSGHNALRCFADTGCKAGTGHWFDRWLQQYQAHISLTSAQEESLSQLIPLLLCGEQSAQLVFGSYAARKDIQNQSRQALERIELDEHIHEIALQWLLGTVGVPDDLHARKRRAQKFYTAIGQATAPGMHFANIEQLDSGVCIIMHAITQSNLGKTHPLSKLFEQIKNDEARHVGLSRHYANKLGAAASKRAQNRTATRHALANFLSPDGHHFEQLGIDADKLLQRIKGQAL